MMNIRAVATDSRDEESDAVSSWRSFGSIAAGLAARAEERRAEVEEDYRFAPVAWAAE